MMKIDVIYLIFLLLVGCSRSEFALGTGEENRESVVPYFFSRPSELLGRGIFIPSERRRYWEMLVDKAREGEVRNHTRFKGGRRNVTINAIELVWKAGDEGPYDRINGSIDIHTLTLNAKIVKILSPLMVPGADVIINAQILEVDSGGLLEITPKFDKSRPADLGEPGKDGERAGSIVLNVEELINRSERAPILIARGGRGQSGALGRNGRDGAGVPRIGKDGLIYKEKLGCFRTDGFSREIGNNEVLQLQDFKCYPVERKGRLKWPENGEDAVSGSRPGNSGDGGTIITDIPLTDEDVDLSPGRPGSDTPGYVGGAAGTPQKAYALVQNYSSPGGLSTLIRHTRAGKNALPLTAEMVRGRPGRIVPLGASRGSWMTSGYRKVLQWYAEDHYLAHSFERAAELYKESLTFPLGKDGESRWLALNARLQLQKLFSHRDFFLRPVGRIPDVYFYRKNGRIVGEIENAVELLYRIRRMKGGDEAYGRILPERLTKEREKALADFYGVLEKGKGLLGGNGALPTGGDCAEETFPDLLRPVSWQMPSDLSDMEEEDGMSLLKSLLEMSETLTGGNGNLSLWGQGIMPGHATSWNPEACEKISVESGEWIAERRRRHHELKSFVLEAAETYLSIQKKVFNKDAPFSGGLEELERESKKILLKHYTDAVSSYQYYHLSSWQGFFPWEKIVSRADELSEQGEGDWWDLRVFYQEELEKIFRPQKSSFLTDTLSIHLGPEQLEQLRRRGRLYLNLLDEKEVYKGREGVKIQTIELWVGGGAGGTYDLSVIHPGRFYIQRGGKTYYGEISPGKTWTVGGTPEERGSGFLQGDFLKVFEQDRPLTPLPGGIDATCFGVGEGGRTVFRSGTPYFLSISTVTKEAKRC